ncbi:hypothetical protein EOPP23_14385 [Endozoicomonas sp. OPT23]|uniref:extracellular solute-binding protein n=1 Tax=Endozoicomonas sp. OPT23 TaxID=2072845 RepID=UPI00129A14B1|nr:extracellular solute-binding protein [Endozoicomonas sp. OPT23]MRI34178.1 hypothetical protein [Endozoicomonas sp. OPT23]
MKRSVYLLLAFLAASHTLESVNAAELVHGIIRYGTPKYKEGFHHFEYVNPAAPKGGVFRQSVIGQFDSTNPYIDRGLAAAGSNYRFDSLLQRSWDEPLTKYGLIAEKIEQDPDNNWVAFHINPKARFHDGSPVTAEDVKFSFDSLRREGSAFYRHFFRDIDYAEVTSSRRVLFKFVHNKNLELALIMGQMPVFSRQFAKKSSFGEPGIANLMGSGPYKVAKVIPGRSIHYERNADYWGKDLPVNRGRYNFDKLVFEYYKDATVAMEGLFNKEYDVRIITDPSIWNSKLTPNELSKYGLKQSLFINGNPQSLNITFNNRSRFLSSPDVRESLGYAMDFEFVNQKFYRGMYVRAHSFFAGTALASWGLPDNEELRWLNPWKSKLPTELFSETFVVPGSRIGVGDRIKRGKALRLLKQAGWHIKSNQQVNRKGENLELNAMVTTLDHEKLMLAFKQGLKYLGVELHVQRVDPLQYIERVREFDFDIILSTQYHTLSPGTEQESLWGSETANQKGSKNYAGVQSEVVDDLVNRIPEAKTRAEQLSMIRALDRVLLWGYYSLPLRYLPKWVIIHRDNLRYPDHPAPYALDFSAWWAE